MSYDVYLKYPHCGDGPSLRVGRRAFDCVLPADHPAAVRYAKAKGMAPRDPGSLH